MTVESDLTVIRQRLAAHEKEIMHLTDRLSNLEKSLASTIKVLGQFKASVESDRITQQDWTV